jgi:hypothetical protein
VIDTTIQPVDAIIRAYQLYRVACREWYAFQEDADHHDIDPSRYPETAATQDRLARQYEATITALRDALIAAAGGDGRISVTMPDGTLITRDPSCRRHHGVFLEPTRRRGH